MGSDFTTKKKKREGEKKRKFKRYTVVVDSFPFDSPNSHDPDPPDLIIGFRKVRPPRPTLSGWSFAIQYPSGPVSRSGMVPPSTSSSLETHERGSGVEGRKEEGDQRKEGKIAQGDSTDAWSPRSETGNDGRRPFFRNEPHLSRFEMVPGRITSGSGVRHRSHTKPGLLPSC